MRSSLAAIALAAGGFCLSVINGDSHPAAGQTPARPAINPAEIIKESCRSSNPYFITTRRVGFTLGDSGAAVVAANDSAGDKYTFPDNPTQFVFATAGEVGSLHGIAYDAVHDAVYLAANHEAWAAFGPGGAGGIYRVDLATQGVQLVARLPAGSDHHNAQVFFDLSEVPWVGRTSLGDIDSDGGHTLFIANLDDRRIYYFSLPAMTPLGSFDHGAARETWAANARPFGLGYRDGWLYHGVVDSREDAALAGSLSAHIYRSRGDGTEMSEVASFGLDYTREPPWSPWSYSVYPVPDVSQPLVSDIEFRPNGDLIIGLADRLQTYRGTTGDVLPSRASGVARWSVDTTSDHYRDEIPPSSPQPAMSEGLLTALAAFPGKDSVVATGLIDWRGGLRWYDNRSGNIAGPEEGLEYVYGDLGPIGDVESLCPAVATATATPTTPPTATPTAESTLTPSASATDQPTATPTARRTPGPIYLPVVLNEQCEVRKEYADVALVLDVSTSMRRLTSSGEPKYDAVRNAAMVFVGLLHLTADVRGAHDQVAVVGFNNTVWIQQELSGDRDAVDAALHALRERMVEGTRLDLALEGGTAALSGSAHILANRPVLILLTDGLPNRVPLGPSGTQEETVLARALAAKDRGIRLYTIGVGRADGELVDRINPALLRAVATDPAMYYETPDPLVLADIYAMVARSVTCPAADFWGRR